MLCADPLSFARTANQSGIGIDQLLLLGTVVDEQVDEGADLCRQMVTMRIDRVHRELHRPVFRQETDQPARFEIIADQKSRLCVPKTSSELMM